jgi:hypothetical protein
MVFLVKQDEKLYTGKTYRHNFQWYNFDEENCLFYVWHKKEIKLIESKNLWSTMNVFFLKDWKLNVNELTDNIKSWISTACHIFSAFDEDNGWFYNFLPYFPTKSVEEKNTLFQKLWLNIQLSNSPKWVLIKNNESENKVNIEDLDTEWKIWFLFELTLLYWKFENKWEKLSAIKIQLPLFGQFLSTWNEIRNIQKSLQDNWIFIQISENVQWDKHTYEITSNDYELLEIFAKLYLPVENFSQITKREQAQEAIEALKTFLGNEWNNELIQKIDNSCVKLLQKI